MVTVVAPTKDDIQDFLFGDQCYKIESFEKKMGNQYNFFVISP